MTDANDDLVERADAGAFDAGQPGLLGTAITLLLAAHLLEILTGIGRNTYCSDIWMEEMIGLEKHRLLLLREVVMKSCS